MDAPSVASMASRWSSAYAAKDDRRQLAETSPAPQASPHASHASPAA